MIRQSMVLLFAVAASSVFLGAGCAKQSLPPTPDGGRTPVMRRGTEPAATTEQSADPLADDLDAAIEELKIIDGVVE